MFHILVLTSFLVASLGHAQSSGESLHCKEGEKEEDFISLLQAKKPSSLLGNDAISSRTPFDQLIRDWNCDYASPHPEEGEAEAIFQDAKSCNFGVYPNLRQRGCGAENLAVPKIFKTPGHGRFIIDVGLGTTAEETMAGVNNGYVVFAFDMLPGNVQAIKKKYSSHKRLQFIELTKDASGNWTVPELTPPSDGSGFAYVFLAGLSDVESTAKVPASGTSFELSPSTAEGDREVPILPLPRFIPSWAEVIEFMKLDTQGYELKILDGAKPMLEAHRFRYVQYEFAPWLMYRSELGDPMRLLKLMPKMKAICFDMMGDFNKLPHKTAPMESYFAEFNEGSNSERPVVNRFGPWDDIMCYWPAELQDGEACQV